MCKFMWGFPGGSGGKESACNVGDTFSPWVGKIPWRREWLPTPVFLSGKFHEQRSLAVYSIWGHKESDMTEWLNTAQTCMYFRIRKQEFCMAFWLGGWGSHVLCSFIFDNELNFLFKSLAWRWSTLTNGNMFSFHSSNHSEKYFQ